jgi:DNA-binding LacI/PurR family transcriptional regulator
VTDARPSRVTSQQVAKHAGVSRTTVSFVLNNVVGAGIPKETRQRVLRSALALGYVPNAAAKSLASGASQTIGLVVANTQHLQVDAFIPQVLYSLCQDSHDLGYRVLLETVEDVSKPGAYDDLVRGQRIDGLIVINTRSDDAQLPDLIRRNFPVVLLGFADWATLGDRTGAIWTDARQASRRATEHLLQLGHSRIAHITFSPEDYHATQDRKRGYLDALQDAKLSDQGLLEHGNYSADSGFEAANRLFKRRQRPTALFAGNDTVAIGAMAAIRQLGLRIPEDVAVVGYDDIPIARHLAPALTTVRVSATEHGRLAIRILVQLMHSQPTDKVQQLLHTPLIVRDSCGARVRNPGLYG